MDTLENNAVAPTLENGADLVNDLHTAFGVHKARAVHAKGIILEGTFEPAEGASKICMAPLFEAPSPRVTVRFSDFTGFPDIPDNSPDANPRGFAVKFRLDDGSEYDVVSHNYNGFPTKTATEFGALLRAIGTSGPDVVKPTPLETFLSTHPIAKHFLTTQRPAPLSYATTAYYGVNAVEFTNLKSSTVVVRYRFVPQAGEHYLDEAVTAAMAKDYLQAEITERVLKEPVVFDWVAQVATPTDVVDDPSVAWPEDRPLVRLGTIRITNLAPDQGCADKSLRFLPGHMPRGMIPADPMLILRDEAYPISQRARQ